MYDEYEPVPSLSCLWCGEPSGDCQGKDGPNALFRWRQFEAHPIDQPIDEDARIDPARFSEFSLPESFSISCWCSNHHVMQVDCRCENGVWVEVNLDQERLKVAEARKHTHG